MRVWTFISYIYLLLSFLSKFPALKIDMLYLSCSRVSNSYIYTFMRKYISLQFAKIWWNIHEHESSLESSLPSFSFSSKAVPVKMIFSIHPDSTLTTRISLSLENDMVLHLNKVEYPYSRSSLVKKDLLVLEKRIKNVKSLCPESHKNFTRVISSGELKK